MLNQLVHFLETAFIEQQFDTFPNGQLSLTMLPFAALASSAFFSGSMTTAEFFQTIQNTSVISCPVVSCQFSVWTRATGGIAETLETDN